MLKPTQAFLNEILTAAIAHAVTGPVNGFLDGLFLGLFVGPTPGLTPGMALSDFTEASYDGYARQAIVWHPPFVEGVSVETVLSTSLYFTPTGDSVSNDIAGLLVCSAGTAGTLKAAEYWGGGQNNIGMASSADAFSLSLLFQLDAAGNFGKGAIVR